MRVKDNAAGKANLESYLSRQSRIFPLNSKNQALFVQMVEV